MTGELPAARWVLTLYVSGASPRSTEAIMTIRRICDEDLAGQVDLTVVNAYDNAAMVKKDQILALPTLVKHSPAPLRYLVGNLSDAARVRSGLDLEQSSPRTPAPEHTGEETGLTDSVETLAELRRQIHGLEETLAAITTGGVDAVVVGPPETEQVYTLINGDRPYRVIVERMGEGAATVSDRGVILFANPQLAHFLGVERDSMIGRDLTDYVDEGQRDALDALLQTTRIGRSELAIRKSDGEDIPLLVAATALDMEGVLIRCLVFTDLTMQKRMEHQAAETTAQAHRQRIAREVNDTIVQGLVAAEMALDLERFTDARKAIDETSGHARRWIGELAVDHRVAAGTAVRSAPRDSDTR